MKLLNLLFLLPLLAGTSACLSPQEKAMEADAEIPCTCGGPDALFDGCGNSLCMNGQNNPDNPNCVCGGMQFGPTGGN